MGVSKGESEMKRRKERNSSSLRRRRRRGEEEEVQRLNVHAEVCMSCEGLQLSQTIGGGKVLLRMTIGSLTPVSLVGGWGDGGGGPHLLQDTKCVCVFVCV